MRRFFVEASVRYKLREWDPADVADLKIDAYEFMIVPLLSRLRDGAERSHISDYLATELENHFGRHLDPMTVDAFAGRLIAWWNVRPGKRTGEP